MKKIKIYSIGLMLLLGLLISGYEYFKPIEQQKLGATILMVPQGGTGASSFAAGQCLKGNGTGAIIAGACSTSVGTVTSVDMSVPTGLSISGNPITASGTLALTLQSGYNIPLNDSTTNWNTAYSWGNHAGLYPTFTYASSSYYLATNPSNFITSSALSPYLTSATAASTYPSFTYASSTYYLASNPNSYIAKSNLSASNPITYNSGTGAFGWTNSNNYITLGSLSGTSPISYDSGTGGISISQSASTTNGYLSSSDWNTFNQKADASSVANKTTLYHWNGASNITGYEMFRTIPDTAIEVAEATTTIANTKMLIDSYVSSSTALQSQGGLNFISIPGGTWIFNTWATVNNAAGTNVIVYDFYRRATSGVETYLFTATSSSLTTSNASPLTYQVTNGGFTASSDGTDRLVAKVYAFSSANGRTITFYYSGTQHYSHVETPFTITSSGYARLFDNNTWTGTNTFNSQLTFGTASGTAITATNFYGSLSGTASGNPAETTSTIGSLINGATATTAPSDTDKFSFSDTIPLLRYITWSNIKTTLKTYFDTLYALSSHTQATSTITGIFSVGSGGTGASSLTGLLLGNGANPVTTITNNSTNWDKYNQWDGGSTGLVVATGRTSLGLGTMAVEANTGSTTITTLGTISTGSWAGTTIPVNKGGTGLTSGYNNTNWDTAYTQSERWNGGATDLVAATGRTSLGLGTMALEANTGSTTITTLGTIGTGNWQGTTIKNAYIASSTEFLSDISWNGSLVANASTTNLTVSGNLYASTLANPYTFTTASGTAITATNFYGTCTAASSDSTWTLHNSYPAACSAGNYVTAIGDTLTCAPLTTMTYPATGIALSTGSAWGTSITDNSANWNTAYTDRLKWDGGATGLTAATGRTSLGLTDTATIASTTFYLSSNPNSYTAAETASTIGTLINGSTATTSPDDTDRFAFSASSLLRYITWANIKSTLKTYFDALYAAYSFGANNFLGTGNFTTSGTVNATTTVIGTRLNIPTTASLVTNNSGDIGIDTTSGQLRFNDGTATRTIMYLQTPSFTIASTSLTGGSATSTIPLGFAAFAETWGSVICGSSGGTGVGTTTLRFGDGTNFTNTLTATSTAYSQTLTSNNSFTATEARQVQIISTAGSPNYITCTVKKTVDSD